MLVMFLALFGSTSWIQVVQAEALAEHPRNTRALYDSYEVQRGLDHRRRRRHRDIRPVRRRLLLPAGLYGCRHVGARHRIHQPGAGVSDGHRAGDEPRALAARTSRSSSPASNASSPARHRGARTCCSRSTRPRSAPHTRACRVWREPCSPSNRRPAASWRWRRRRATTPTCSRRTPRGRPRRLRRARRRPGRSAVQPRHRRQPQPARFDVQAGDGRGGLRHGGMDAAVHLAEPGGVSAAAVIEHGAERLGGTCGPARRSRSPRPCG